MVIPPPGDVPHAGRHGAAGTGHPCHLAEPGIGVAHEGDDQAGERGVEGVVFPRQLLGGADAHIGTRVAISAGGGELRRRIDRRDAPLTDPRRDLGRQPTRSAADVENAHPLADTGRVGESSCQ